MNLKSIIIGIAIGMVLLFSINLLCTHIQNDKIAKLEADKQTYIDSAKYFLNKALISQENEQKDKVYTDSLESVLSSILKMKNEGDLRIHNLQQQIYAVSIQNAALYANSKLKDTNAFKIDSNGVVKSDTSTIRYVDSVLVQNDLLTFDNGNLTEQNTVKDSIIGSKNKTINACDMAKGNLLGGYKSLQKVADNLTKENTILKHQKTGIKVLGWIKTVVIGFAAYEVGHIFK